MLPGLPITNIYMEREEWFVVREVARFERREVLLSFFDVSFQSRFLLHEFIMRLDDLGADRTSWLQEAGWHSLRATALCEDAILPIIGLLPGRESGHFFRSRTWSATRAVLLPTRVSVTSRTTGPSGPPSGASC